jgi:hypothetical protein
MKNNFKKLICISVLFIACFCSHAQTRPSGGLISSSGGTFDPCHPPVCYPFQNLDLLQIYATDLQILNAVSGGSTSCCTRQGTQDSILAELKKIDTNTGNLNTITTNAFIYTYLNSTGVHTYTYGTYWAITVQNVGTSNAQFDGSVLPPGASVVIPYARNRLPRTVSINALKSTLLVLVQ